VCGTAKLMFGVATVNWVRYTVARSGCGVVKSGCVKV
jgi:hypothetical protein